MTDQPAPAPHVSRVAEMFRHSPSRRLDELHETKPVTTQTEHVGINGRIALFITAVVGTMWAAYIFTVISLISAPSAFQSGQLLTIISWIAQTFLQLVLLPVIIVGQNIQGRASDKRAIETYKDAEAILSECLQLQQHLQAQDKILDDLVQHLQKIAPHNAN